MTDNDIIKALECCYSLNLKKCKNVCPLIDKPLCTEWLLKYALDLINRQKAEIESDKHYYNECLKELAKAKVEIERLEKDSKRLKKVQMQLDDAMKMYSTIKAEAVKEFDERLKKEAICDKSPIFRIPYYQISVETFNNIVKEMRGENK